MATRWVKGEVVQFAFSIGSLGETDDDAHCQGVASDTGEEFTEQVGSSVEVVSGRAADYFDVVAFPVRQSARGGPWARSGYGREICDGESESGIGSDGDP
jgi:hypothetical protein